MRVLTWVTVLACFATAARPAAADRVADLERAIERKERDLREKEGQLAQQRGHPQAVLQALDALFTRLNRAAAATAGAAPLPSRTVLLAELAAKEAYLAESVNPDRIAKATADLKAHRDRIAAGMQVVDAWLAETPYTLPLADFPMRMATAQQFVDVAERFRVANDTLAAEVEATKAALERLRAELARPRDAVPPPPDGGRPSGALPPKAQPRYGTLDLEWPRKDELDRVVSAYDAPGLVHFKVRTFTSELEAGAQHLVLAVEGGRESHLWTWAPAGTRQVIFAGEVPVPLGTQTVVISAPDHPEAAAIRLTLVRVNPREAANEKAARDREADVAKLDARLANPDPKEVRYYHGPAGFRRHIDAEKAVERLGQATALLQNDRFPAALEALKDAEGLLVAAGTWGEPSTVGTGFGVCTQDDVWERRVQVAVATGDLALLREARIALVAHTSASAPARVGSTGQPEALYARAGNAAAAFAAELLMLGAVDVGTAARLRDLALPYWRKAGRTEVVPPDWAPR